MYFDFTTDADSAIAVLAEQLRAASRVARAATQPELTGDQQRHQMAFLLKWLRAVVNEGEIALAVLDDIADEAAGTFDNLAETARLAADEKVAS